MKTTLRSFYESHYPILWLNTYDEPRADELIRELTQDRRMVEWNLAQGVVNFKTRQPQSEYMALDAALAVFLDTPMDNYAIVLRDAHVPLRDNPLAVTRLKALAQRLLHDDDTLATVFIVSSVMHIPPELEPYVTLFDLGTPSEDEIAEQIRRFAEQYGDTVDEDTIKRLQPSLRGLGRQEIHLVLNRAYQNDGGIGVEDLALILDEKEQIIRKSGILELVRVEETIEDIGGLDQLKDWLKIKARILDNLKKAREFGVESPKGTLVVGMPGCGKSLTAKAAAHLFGLPLLRLDVGRLMGRYVGDSEGNMRRALALAESVSPCVLWIDELEKAFAGLGSGGSGSEVTSRLFGFFLTWMQEKSGAVFVIATANDITALPPELLRRGRFDEIFYVDFPSREERQKILEIHIKKRRPKDVERIDMAGLAAKTDGFCGADLESAIKDAVEKVFVEDRKIVTTDDVLKAIHSTRPLSEVMKDRISDYKAKFEKLRIRPASGPGK
jgi:SpoVK/Ycf46/Vps4 family AAA+-type ATPase